jgi:hypothetical protein
MLLILPQFYGVVRSWIETETRSDEMRRWQLLYGKESVGTAGESIFRK